MCSNDDIRCDVHEAKVKFDKALRHISGEVSSLRESVNEQGKLIARQNRMMEDHKEAVDGLIAIYETGTGLVRFLKWLAGVAAAFATLYGSYQALIHWRPH